MRSISKIHFDNSIWKWAIFLLFMNGFKVASSCSGTIELIATNETQVITTPNFREGGTYPPLLNCTFIIKAPDKTKLQLSIDFLEMEPRLFTECVDFISIKEGATEDNSSRSEVFCENVYDREIVSEFNNITVVIRTDNSFEFRGATISYRYFEADTCPPSWYEFFDAVKSDTYCLKLAKDEKVNWIEAQNQCLEQRSNLVVIESNEKYNELWNHFGTTTDKVWVGYTDAVSEGKLQAINGDELAPYPVETNSVLLGDNSDDNDCLTLDLREGRSFRLDSCSVKNTFICERKKTGETYLYPPNTQQIVDGAYSKSSQYSLWLLLFLIGLLFLTILAFLCFMCWKQKESPRVHTETTVAQQNAFMNEPSRNVPAVAVPITNNNVVPVSTSPKPTESIKQPTTFHSENSRTPRKFPVSVGPNHVPMSEEPSDTEKVETSIMGPSRFSDPEPLSLMALTQPKPQPRTLPPMPTREGTFQSMNTKDGSTLRTRRNKDVFDRPVMHVLDNVSAISLDEFWSNKRP